jgi:hypothetical protein
MRPESLLTIQMKQPSKSTFVVIRALKFVF